MKKLIFTLLLLIFHFSVFSQIIYVTPNGAGLKNGNSWANALDGNSPAGNGYSRFADTMQLSASGTIFWVAEGVYVSSTDNDRTKSFQVPEGVVVYGGFAGDETLLQERDWSVHASTLSGEIGASGISTDNSIHVVTTSGENWSEYAILDGLVVSDGNADDPSLPSLFDPSKYGGGIYAGNKLRVMNCLFTNNSSQQGGGGIYSTGLLDVTNCIFTHNHAAAGAGVGVHYSSTVNISASKFAQNDAWYNGGGIENEGTCYVTNCLIVNNGAVNGGGVLVRGYTIISGSTIANNSVCVWFYSTCLVRNSIITGGEISVYTGASIDCKYTCTDSFMPGEGNIRQNPLFVSPTFVAGSGGDGLAADWRLRWCSPCFEAGNNSMIPAGVTTDLDGNPRLRYGSVDMGAYETDTTGVLPNVIGFGSRIFICDTIQYRGAGNNWETALAGNAESCRYPGRTMLYEAMKDASPGTEIWVKKGKYRCSLNNSRDHAFDIGAGVKVFGGFSGNEATADQRNLVTNKTIFSGNVGDSSLVTDNSYHVMLINPDGLTYSDSALIDGVIVENGYADGSSPASEGAGICIASNTKIRMKSVEIRYNTALGNGGGLKVNNQSEVALYDCRIINNNLIVRPEEWWQTSASGCGIFNDGKLHLKNTLVRQNSNATGGSGIYNSDSLFLSNCTLDSNTSVTRFSTGGGIVNAGYCLSENTSINNNTCNAQAGGIYNGSGASMLLYNNDINSNSNTILMPFWGSNSGGIRNEGMMTILNSTVRDNLAQGSGGGLFNSSGASCFIVGSSFLRNNSLNTPTNGAFGGGIANEGFLSVNRSWVCNNQSSESGGGIYNPTMIRNCIVANNNSGLMLGTGCLGVFNTTIANNLNQGIAVSSSDTFLIRNCIVDGNDVQLSGNFNIANTCMTVLYPGNNNVFGSPFWIGPSEGKGPGFDGFLADWGLKTSSPCINRGDNALLSSADSLDALGNTRLMYGVVDMGGAESQLPPDSTMPVPNTVIWELFKPKPANIRTTADDPIQSVLLDKLETPAIPYDLTSQSRIRGYILPQKKGYYKFYMASDPGGKFFLSTDSTEFKTRLILSNDDGNGNWPANPGAVDSVYLESEKSYFFEAFCQNTAYPWMLNPLNYLKIGWVMPDSSSLHVITGNYLRQADPKQVYFLNWEIFDNKTTCDFNILKNTAEIPDKIIKLDSLLTPDQSIAVDHFASRIRGYLIPPVNGDYSFYFACADAGQFWLSNDTSMENAQLKSTILSTQTDWTQNISNQTLVAGQKYFFEILHFDTVYTDMVKLGWLIPGDTVPLVIKTPFIMGYNISVPVSTFSLLDHERIAYPNWTIIPRYHLTPWNASFKSIRSIKWKTTNTAVATINADGVITTQNPGICEIIGMVAGDTLLSDTMQIRVVDYYGPYFVKQNASENSDGHSWNNAIGLTKLLDILNQGQLTQQVKVYVAEGTYKPKTSIDQNKTFNLNHTRFVGGFASSVTGNDTTNRDYANHETILSGEIGIPGETIDNSYHVVTSRDTCTIDGFTIRDGRASCSTHGWTPGLSYYKRDDNGGGVIAEGGNLRLVNCKLTNNSAWNSGGGLYCREAIAKLENCAVYENKAVSEMIGTGGTFFLIINTQGAGISASTNSIVNLTDCKIYDNLAMGYAGAIYQRNSIVNLTNCSANNNSGSAGYSFYVNSGSALNMNNVTIKGHVQYFFYSSGTIRNTTIQGNLNAAYCYSKNSISMDNSIITGFDPHAVAPPNGNTFADSIFAVKYSILGNSLFGASKEVLLSDSIPDQTIWLDSMANNGGPTPTMRLKNIPGNPAKTNGNPLYLGTTDQRGFLRTDTVSIGAYQWVWPSQITISPDHANMAPGDSLAFTVSVLPEMADDSSWTAVSSDTNLLDISGSFLHALTMGSAHLIVRTNDGNRRDTSYVLVMNDSVTATGVISSSGSACYDALRTIKVAGDGNSFVVQNGGSSTLIAGEKISLLPGTTVERAAYMHGYITLSGPWCELPAVPSTPAYAYKADEINDPGDARENGFIIYPNPTNGNFTIENPTDPGINPVRIQIYNLMGSLIMEEEIFFGRKHEFSIEEHNPGIYFVRVIRDEYSEMKKIIKK
jgi:predicted outer membrane repeat protein